MESGSFFITCYIYIWACEGPLSRTRWEELRSCHLVTGDRLYGETTYARFLMGVQPITGVPCGHTTEVKRASLTAARNVDATRWGWNVDTVRAAR